MAGGVVLRNVQGTAAGGQQRQQRLEQGGPIRPGGRIKVRRRPGVAPPQAYPGKLPGQAVRVVQRRAVPVRHHHESAPQGRRKRGGQKLRPGAQTVGHMGQTRCHGPGLSQPVRRGGKIQRHGYPPLRSDEKNATL